MIKNKRFSNVIYKMTKTGADSSPTVFEIQLIATPGLLDNRLGRGVGGIQISGDVIVMSL